MIAQAGKPLVELTPFEEAQPRKGGIWEGKIRMSKDFDIVHAFTKKVRDRMIDAYREFEAAYRIASNRFRSGEWNVKFPPGFWKPVVHSSPNLAFPRGLLELDGSRTV